MKFFTEYKNVDGVEVPYVMINNDVYGNARIVVHFLDLGIKMEDYGSVPGLTKYRAKWYGGGYVMQAVNVDETIRYMQDQARKYYAKKESK